MIVTAGIAIGVMVVGTFGPNNEFCPDCGAISTDEETGLCAYCLGVKDAEEDEKLKKPTLSADGGDPLTTSLYAEPEVTRAWPEWHDSRKWYLEFEEQQVPMSRVIERDTSVFFLDIGTWIEDTENYQSDGKLTKVVEMLYHDELNVYEILEHIDNKYHGGNSNGWFDYSDELFQYGMIATSQSVNRFEYQTLDEAGIIAINYSNQVPGYGDMFGEKRQYTDCLYEGQYIYPDCKAVADTHFAIVAYNQCSIMLKGGECVDSFGAQIGSLED